jgi:hypothetical protein
MTSDDLRGLGFANIRKAAVFSIRLINNQPFGSRSSFIFRCFRFDKFLQVLVWPVNIIIRFLSKHALVVYPAFLMVIFRICSLADFTLFPSRLFNIFVKMNLITICNGSFNASLLLGLPGDIQQ